MKDLNITITVAAAIIAGIILILGFAGFDLIRQFQKAGEQKCEEHAQVFNATDWGYVDRYCYLQVDGKWFWIVGRHLHPVIRDKEN